MHILVAFVAQLAIGIPLSVSFSPGGLLFPYYIGVGYELQRAGRIQPNTPIGGSSAGSIIAAAIACGVSEDTVRSGLADLCEDVRKGTRLNVALRTVLDTILDDDAAEAAEAHSLTICYFEVLPRPGGRTVTSWTSKDDLISCICASSNWPFFFSRWPFVKCRGALALDGFFAQPRARFGCPPLAAEQQLAVCALPGVRLAAFDEAMIIQPGLRSEPLPIPQSEWFARALEPASDEDLDAMIDLGRKHARAWIALDV